MNPSEGEPIFRCLKATWNRPDGATILSIRPLKLPMALLDKGCACPKGGAPARIGLAFGQAVQACRFNQEDL